MVISPSLVFFQFSPPSELEYTPAISLPQTIIFGFEGEIVMDPSKPDGTMRKLTDISRIKSLGWEPKISLEEGLRQTYQWFCQKYESGDYAAR